MSFASWVLIFALAILFGLFKLVQFFWRKTVKAFRHKNRKIASKEIYVEHFPEEAFPNYSISERDFAKIAYKAGYRHPRTEEVLVDGKQVTIRFTSQSGYSVYDAYIVFSLEGREIGEYRIRTTNMDSELPRHIADKIRSEIRVQVGL